jgi:flagellar basal-body rod protein FlgB
MGTIDLVAKALNIRASYHRVLAGNIANVETPGYREKDIDFRKELDRNIGSTADIEAKESGADVIARADGNTVNMESQIVKLTENSMLFNSLVQVITKRFAMMKYVINEGRR